MVRNGSGAECNGLKPQDGFKQRGVRPVVHFEKMSVTGLRGRKKEIQAGHPVRRLWQ